VAVMDTGGRGVATVLQGDDKEFEMVLECRGAKGGRRAFSLSIYLHWGGEGGGGEREITGRILNRVSRASPDEREEG